MLSQDEPNTQEPSPADAKLPYKVSSTFPGPRLTSIVTDMCYSSDLQCLFISTPSPGVSLLPIKPIDGDDEDAESEVAILR